MYNCTSENFTQYVHMNYYIVYSQGNTNFLLGQLSTLKISYDTIE